MTIFRWVICIGPGFLFESNLGDHQDYTELVTLNLPQRIRIKWNKISHWIILNESIPLFESNHGDIWNFTELFTLIWLPKTPNRIKSLWWYEKDSTGVFCLGENCSSLKMIQYLKKLGSSKLMALKIHDSFPIAYGHDFKEVLYNCSIFLTIWQIFHFNIFAR